MDELMVATEQPRRATRAGHELQSVVLRVPRKVHDALRRAAYEQHTSINKLATDELTKMMARLFAQEAI